MNFNEKLTSIRRAKGLSQEQLASQIHVSRQAISKWETAESQPDLAKLVLLSSILEVSLDELCGRKLDTTAMQPVSPLQARTKMSRIIVIALQMACVLAM